MLKREQRVVPLYYQVQHTIAIRIRRGEYAPGSQIPSESELSRELDVSRVTIREALRALTEEGLLVKAQGRGTFVADPLPPLPHERRFTGYLEDLWNQLPSVSVRHIEITRVPAAPEIARILELSPTDSDVVRIKRARHIDNSPYAFTINLMPPHIGSQFDEHVLRTMPVVRFFEEELRIPIGRALETIHAAAADAEVARWLEVPVFTPVMHVRRVLYTAGQRPLELVDSYYRSDKFHYSVQLLRVEDNGRWAWSEAGRPSVTGQVIRIQNTGS
jgi:GntR family transcriptional regulator